MAYDDARSMGTDDDSVGNDVERTAEIVGLAVAGDERAFGALYDAWFDRVYDTAYGVVRDHAVAAEVAQDTFLRAWQRLDTVRDPTVFGGWLLRIARNTALNRRRTEVRTTAVDDEGLAVIERGGPSPVNAPAGFRVEDRLGAVDDPAAAVEDDEIVELVNAAVDALDGRDAEVLQLGLRYGLSPAEIGKAVGLNRNAANQAVHRARQRLRGAVEARVLWRRGAPDCPDLAAALADAGVERFGSEAVAVTTAHASECARCQERRRLTLDPAALFGAVPLVAAPGLLKSQVAHALAAQGVPMSGSAHVGGSAGGPGGDATAVHDAGDVGPMIEPVIEPVPTAPTHRRHPVLTIAALVAAFLAIVVIAGVVVFAASADKSDRPIALAPTTPPSLPAPTTVVPATDPPPATAAAESPAPTVPPRVVEPAPVLTTPTDPPPTAPPAPTPTGSLTLTPSTKPTPWVMPNAPVLTWVTEHAASVVVEGPGVSSTAPSGSAALCPPSGTSASICPAPAGTYRYRLTVRDGSGAVVVTREVLLVVT